MSHIFDALVLADEEVVKHIQCLPGKPEKPPRGFSGLRVYEPLHGTGASLERPATSKRWLIRPGAPDISHWQIRKYLVLAFASLALIWAGTNYALLSDGRRGTARSIKGIAFEAVLKPANEVRVAATVGGTVSQIFVNVGDKVSIGDKLVRVDDRSSEMALQQAAADLRTAQAGFDKFRLQLVEMNARLAVSQRQEQQVPTRQWRDSPERAEAAYSLALANYNRTKMLYDAGVLAKQELDTRATELRVAQDDLQNAKRLAKVSAKLEREQTDQANLQAQVAHSELEEQLRQATMRYERAKQLAEGTLVRATQGGVISDVPVHIGDQVTQGVVLARMAQIDHMIAEVPVTAKMISQLRVQQQAWIEVPSSPPQQIEGHVRLINPLPAPNMTHTVEVEFSNPTGLLLAGQPAEVRFATFE